ncbi:metal ABC transporter ATP-binding protein [Patescibacteria group bacterium]|nr:metal ABC transporter ATP-binding protein [Patescibacteria group bacterium]
MKPIPLIEVKDLGFAYAQNLVLEAVSFVVEKGEYVGIVGPNGGGKTTLLKILVGLLTPTTGEVLIAGKPAVSARAEIGYVPQRVTQDHLSFPATVYELVESGRTVKKGLFGRLDAKDKEAIRQALKVAGIEELQGRLMSDLSGGQRQRVYVARALAAQPKILILDEPFVGVDVTTQAEFYAFLKQLNEKHGLTILFVSHDIDAISEEVQSVLCLNRGLLCSGSPALLHEPKVIDHIYGKKITHIHRHA